MRLSVRMLCAPHSHVLIDIKLILSVTPWEFPVPKIRFFSKPEVNHKKVKIAVFALDIAFKLD